MLNVLRRQTGLPHRIVLDEAHYYLHEDAHHLLDFDRNGYTVITYCASSLPSSLLEATEVMIVTCNRIPQNWRHSADTARGARPSTSHVGRCSAAEVGAGRRTSAH